MEVISPTMCDGKILISPNSEAVVRTNRCVVILYSCECTNIYTNYLSFLMIVGLYCVREILGSSFLMIVGLYCIWEILGSSFLMIVGLYCV